MRAGRGGALLLALLAAGCVDAAQEAPGPATLAAHEVVAAPAGSGGDDPVLVATPSGALFLLGRDPSRSPPVSAGVATGLPGGALFRSMDAGTTWTALGAPTYPARASDVALDAAPDGSVWSAAAGEACAVVAVSDDEGSTWAKGAACYLPSGDEPQLLALGGGRALLVQRAFMRTPDGIRAPLYAERTDDGGRTWTPLGRADPADGSVSYPFQLALAPDGAIVLAIGHLSPGGVWSPAVLVSRDDGATWTLVTIPAQGEPVALGHARLAADATQLHLAWVEDEGTTSRVLVASSSDGGATWSPPLRVDADEGRKAFPALAASPEGAMMAVWLAGGAHEDALGGPGTVWHVEAAVRSAGSWSLARLSAAPAHEGALCFIACEEEGGLGLHRLGIARLPEGRVAVSWPRSTGGGPLTDETVVAVTDAAWLR